MATPTQSSGESFITGEERGLVLAAWRETAQENPQLDYARLTRIGETLLDASGKSGHPITDLTQQDFENAGLGLDFRRDQFISRLSRMALGAARDAVAHRNTSNVDYAQGVYNGTDSGLADIMRNTEYAAAGGIRHAMHVLEEVAPGATTHTPEEVRRAAATVANTIRGGLFEVPFLPSEITIPRTKRFENYLQAVRDSGQNVDATVQRDFQGKTVDEARHLMQQFDARDQAAGRTTEAPHTGPVNKSLSLPQNIAFAKGGPATGRG